MYSDTIAAISTPIGIGGIGIIKISGKAAIHIASLIFKNSNKNKNLFKESHKLYHGHIIDPDNQKILDEVLVSVMLAPHSYTGEDVVEINVHSGIFLLRTILDIVIKKGARLADPGEFTKRALLNGRIDLTQAEAVIDLINAKSKLALDIANAQVVGVLRNSVETMLDVLNDIIVKIEAAIDFPDSVEPLCFDTEINIIENKIIKKLNELISGYNDGHVLREGLKLVIAGRPNVGKSSLLNRLLKKERAIVTSVPGTTRDIIEETIIISGVPTIISDTAGLHDTIDPVESIGIEKTQELIKSSDLVLFVIDAVNPSTEENRKLFKSIDKKQTIVVINKIDLLCENTNLEVHEEMASVPFVMISSLYNIGIDILKKTIQETAFKNIDFNSSSIIPNLRQKLGFEKCLENMISASEGMKTGLPHEIISLDIAESIGLLNEIIGKNVRPDILNEIFGRYCIGK